MTIDQALNELLARIDRFDASVHVPGCDCCSPEIYFDCDNTYGELVKYSQLKDLIDQLKTELGQA